MASPFFRPGRGFDAQFGQISRLFDELAQGFSAPSLLRSGFAPAFDVHETEAGVIVTADLPGLSEQDVAIELDEAVLTLKGERKGEAAHDEGRFHVQERSFGAFSRRIVLPFAPLHDQVQASFANGTLTITLPRPPEAKPTARKIEITGQQR